MTPGAGYPGGNPWADPATPTQPGAPYAGPPPTAPVPGPTPHGYPVPYGYPGQYAYPGPWGPPPPRGPQRPGQVITAAVLAFVQAGVVLIASLYLWFFASIIDVATRGAPGGYSSSRIDALATEGTVLAVVQLVSAVCLVVGGIRALTARSRTTWMLAVGAHAVQVVLAVYWAVRLVTVMGEVPGADAEGALSAVTIFFAAAPVVGLGMLLVGPGRRWFESPQRR